MILYDATGYYNRKKLGISFIFHLSISLKFLSSSVNPQQGTEFHGKKKLKILQVQIMTIIQWSINNTIILTISSSSVSSFKVKLT